MMSLALVAVIAVAAIGVGYAYTALTTNSSNTVNTEYVTISQDGTGAYNFAPSDGSGNPQKVYWDSNDYKSSEPGDASRPYKTIYTLTNNVEDITIQTVPYKVVKLGNEFTIKATHSSAADSKSSITVTMEAESGFNYADGVVLFFEVTPLGGSPTYIKLTANDTLKAWDGTSAASFTLDRDGSGPDYKTATVKAYIGYPASNPPIFSREHTNDSITGPSATPLVNGVLKFIVTDTAAINNAITGVAVNKSNMTLTAGQSDTATISLTPEYSITNLNDVLKITITGDITATISGNTITITAGDDITSGAVTITSITNTSASATINITAA